MRERATNPSVMCMAEYNRKKALDTPNYANLFCQYIVGHKGDHSWQGVKDGDLQNMQDAVIDVTTTGTTIPMKIDALLHGIEDGDFDVYLEAILSVGHERKRALRGTRTFKLGWLH